MHDIEPYYAWRDYYTAENDHYSPFYGREYSEFHFTNKVYNFYIHPQWDEFGSSTLYLKLLYVDYEERYCIIELIGEWNDAIHNDIMFLKREVIDHLINKGIYRFILIIENVLNFHAAEDDYYAEWLEDLMGTNGWIVLLGTLPHIKDEMDKIRLFNYSFYGSRWDSIKWRAYEPNEIYEKINELVERPMLMPEEE